MSAARPLALTLGAHVFDGLGQCARCGRTRSEATRECPGVRVCAWDRLPAGFATYRDLWRHGLQVTPDQAVVGAVYSNGWVALYDARECERMGPCRAVAAGQADRVCGCRERGECGDVSAETGDSPGA